VCEPHRNEDQKPTDIKARAMSTDDCASPGFAALHAMIDPDPLKELSRRSALWASCPGSDGFALKPYAQIIPRETVDAAIREIVRLRRRASVLDRIAGWFNL
jgi:hypothetical protein